MKLSVIETISCEFMISMTKEIQTVADMRILAKWLCSIKAKKWGQFEPGHGRNIGYGLRAQILQLWGVRIVAGVYVHHILHSRTTQYSLWSHIPELECLYTHTVTKSMWPHPGLTWPQFFTFIECSHSADMRMLTEWLYSIGGSNWRSMR